MEIKILKSILEANEEKADAIRRQLAATSLTMLNMIGSPGSGKTSILEKTLAALRTTLRIAIIEGDLATSKDAERLQPYDIPIIMINTEGGCHLDSPTIQKALAELPTSALDLIFIENVGNLVCPAEFDLGEHAKVAVLSVPEGDDKPSKYPYLFREAKAVILNKIDLLPYTSFNREAFYADLKQLNANIPVFEISCRTGEGMEGWIEWIRK